MRAVPFMSPGLPGIVTSTSAAVSEDHVSTWTIGISSPTNFFANDGTRSVPCTISTSIRLAGTSPETVTVLRMTPW